MLHCQIRSSKGAHDSLFTLRWQVGAGCKVGGAGDLLAGQGKLPAWLHRPRFACRPQSLAAAWPVLRCGPTEGSTQSICFVAAFVPFGGMCLTSWPSTLVPGQLRHAFTSRCQGFQAALLMLKVEASHGRLTDAIGFHRSMKGTRSLMSCHQV